MVTGGHVDGDNICDQVCVESGFGVLEMWTRWCCVVWRGVDTVWQLAAPAVQGPATPTSASQLIHTVQ